MSSNPDKKLNSQRKVFPPARRLSLLLTSALFGYALTAYSQIYVYTNDKGILVLSNVPNNDRMRTIADSSPKEARHISHYKGQYDLFILKAARRFGVDSNLIHAVIAIESSFNHDALSHKGARGLMQLMPATARQYGVINTYDPWQNIRAGTAHLRNLIDEFKDVRLALAAYNAGSTPVRRYKAIPPYPETRNYVRKVMAIYQADTTITALKGRILSPTRNPGEQIPVSSSIQRMPVPSSLAEIARRNRQRLRGQNQP